MKKYIKSALAVLCCTAIGFGTGALTACGGSDKAYSVVYDLNYETETQTRTVSVPKGGRAVNWDPRRDGYELEGWYTDTGFKYRFNFRKPLSDDVKLYAKWEGVEFVTVSFDENYGGKHANTSMQSRKGRAVEEIDAPVPQRLGHVFTGWYKDAACTQAWDFVTDVAASDTTLYAGYKRDGSMKLDENGDPVFDNVTVNVWLGMGWDSGANNNVMWNLAKKFNADPEYSGRIKVNVTQTLSNQDTFSLRVQKTINKNETDKNYYSIDEIYTLAGIDYSADDWYAGASRDSYVDGRLCSVPLVSGVPFLIYNKALMREYNGENALPQSYTEFAELIQEVYDGESADNADFKGIICNSSATWTEVSALAAFVQNGADYIEYADGATGNRWEGGNLAAAATAIGNTYELLGSAGGGHGMLSGDDAYENTARSRVENGTAFMGVISWPTAVLDICDNDAFGVMPLSGLYADGEHKDRIPVHSIGLGFYRSQNLTTTELAAAGVFADYVSRHSYDFATMGGWYPVRRSVAESAEFAQSDNSKVMLLQKVGDPENFYTLDGSTKTIRIATDVVANGCLKPVLAGEPQGAEALSALAERLKASIDEA